VVLLCAFFASEERPALGAYYAERAALATKIILIGSAMAFVFNLLSFYLIKQIGALTSTILGNLKTIILIMGAVLFIDAEILSVLNIFGYCVFFCALFTYSYLNYVERSRAVAAAVGPAAPPDGKARGKPSERSKLLK